ncbi:MAG TPA: GAF domain-containing protein [Anaerolineales bacterium]|nr:GAF domain-containing protein [Anaerolineales bacterium]
MSQKKPSYEELERRCYTAEAELAALHLKSESAMPMDGVTLGTENELATMRALYGLSRMLIEFSTLEDAIQKAAHLVADALKFDRLNIITFDTTAQAIINFYRGGPGHDDSVEVSFGELQEGLSGWVSRTRRSALSSKEIPDDRESAVVQERRKATNCGAIMVIPILYHDQLLGTITAINRPDQRDFIQADVDLMEAVASQIGILIQNNRLYLDLRREEKLRIGLETAEKVANFGSWEFDPITGRGWWSKQMYALLGFEVSENVPDFDSYLEHVHPDDRSLVSRQLGQMLKGEEPHSEEYRTNPVYGAERYVATVVRTVRNDKDIPVQYIGTLIDITERKRAEKSLVEQLKELETLYESGLTLNHILSMEQIGIKLIELLEQKMNWHHTAIRLYDPKTKTLKILAYNMVENVEAADSFNRVSRIGEGMTGWALQRSEVVRSGDLSRDPHYVDTFSGMNSGIYVPMRSREQVIGIISIESEQPNAFSDSDERLVVTLANQAAVALENASLLQTAQQEILERKRVERLLEEEKNQLAKRVEERTADLTHSNEELARALRVKDEFLAIMSHELRTPLNSILGLSEAMQEERQGTLNEKQKRSLQTIATSGQHLLDMINDILDISKIDSGKFDVYPMVIDLEPLCISSMSFIRQQAFKKSILLNYEKDESLVKIYADPRRLKQMLINLLTNAIKFTPEGGKVSLKVTGDRDNDQVHFSVVDTGIGIASTDMKNLFQPFVQVDSSFTRQFEGTGLGLALVNKLTDLHGGSVSVESEIGNGSRFTISLPWGQEVIAREAEEISKIVSAKKTPEQLLADAKLTTSNQNLILLAEDNMLNVLTLSDYLESKGYEIRVAHDGMEALELAKTILPDLILMDMQMPGMDGLEATRRLRADPRFATVPIIALTALAMPGDRERCLEAGASEYLSKPVKLKQLAALMQDLLHA